MSELTELVDCVLDKIANDDKAAKDDLVDAFCKGLINIKDKEN